MIEDRIVRVRDTKELHISHKVYNGIEGIDFRWWVKYMNREGLFMTKKGIFVDMDTFRILRDQINTMIPTDKSVQHIDM